MVTDKPARSLLVRVVVVEL